MEKDKVQLQSDVDGLIQRQLAVERQVGRVGANSESVYYDPITGVENDIASDLATPSGFTFIEDRTWRSRSGSV